MTQHTARRPRSTDVTDGVERAAARGMLRGVGFTDDDFDRPQVGVASSWNEITPCNGSLQQIAAAVKDGVREAGGMPMEFGTISVSDGIAMGHRGMHYSLVSREVIADSVETVTEAERFDATVLLAGCDKSLPGMMMAAARLRLSSVFVYAGTSMPGLAHLSDGAEREVTIIDAFEAVGACLSGRMSRSDVDAVERAYCPGVGGCAGMYTANTMASLAEALGLSLPGSASPPATDRRRLEVGRRSGRAVLDLLDRGLTTAEILTRPAFENAVTVLMTLGGSTNAVLHLLAIAQEAGVPLALSDFAEIADRTPLLADVKPFGRHVMRDVDRVGGIPVVMRALLDAGLLDGSCMTVSGRTVEENLDQIAPPPPDGQVLRSPGSALRDTGGLAVLTGSLAPDGAVAKVAGFAFEQFTGPARVFDGEQEAMDALAGGDVSPGDAIVVRNEGPAGGPGMREMLAITGAVKGAGLGDRTLLITDGRFSGGSTGHCVAHVAPEAVAGGAIALVEDGDLVELDLRRRSLHLLVAKDELAARRARWRPRPATARGVLGRYARLVGSAAHGATLSDAPARDTTAERSDRFEGGPHHD